MYSVQRQLFLLFSVMAFLSFTTFFFANYADINFEEAENINSTNKNSTNSTGPLNLELRKGDSLYDQAINGWIQLSKDISTGIEGINSSLEYFGNN